MQKTEEIASCIPIAVKNDLRSVPLLKLYSNEVRNQAAGCNGCSAEIVKYSVLQ